MNTILTITNLEKTYQTKLAKYQVLQKVNMSVEKGEFVAVMGPSGSGKTTLLNILSGFLGADSGEIVMDNTDLLKVDKEEMAEIRQNKLGFIFQDFCLINGLTCKENILLPQIIAGKVNKEMNQRTEELMQRFGIKQVEDKYPSEISGGQKQRVAIARALSNKPMLILADEPTGNLDSKSSAAVIDTFVTAKKEMGATILMVTHDALSAAYADRVVVLADGKNVNELKRETAPRQFMNDILNFLKETEAQSNDFK